MEDNSFKKFTEQLDKQVRQTHIVWCKMKDDHQLLYTLLDKDKIDRQYFIINAEEIFNRNKN